MGIRRGLLVVAVTALAATISCSKNARIQGVVIDLLADKPLSGALVKIDNPNLNITTTTDKSGHFILRNVPPGSHRVIRMKDGYSMAVDSVIAGEKATVKAATMWLVSPPHGKQGAWAVVGTDLQVMPAAVQQPSITQNASGPEVWSPSFTEYRAPRALMLYGHPGRIELWTLQRDMRLANIYPQPCFVGNRRLAWRGATVGDCTIIVPTDTLEIGDYALCRVDEYGFVTYSYIFTVVSAGPQSSARTHGGTQN